MSGWVLVVVVLRAVACLVAALGAESSFTAKKDGFKHGCLTFSFENVSEHIFNGIELSVYVGHVHVGRFLFWRWVG